MSQRTSEINRQLPSIIAAKVELAGISTGQIAQLMRKHGVSATRAALILLDRAADTEERVR